MREKKLQVFVSSTFTDLIEERQAAVEAILSSGNIPAGMELFSAGDESQMNVIKRWIDESDVYMLILGARYGSIEPKSGKSYTQLEYEYAIEQKKPFFAVVLTDKFIDEKVAKEGRGILEQENNKELKEFKTLTMSKMVELCNDNKDIQLAVFKTLSEFSHSKELIGWIRGDNAVNSNLLADEMARLAKENDELRNSKNQNLTSKYAGLSFEELKDILKKKIINENESDNINLFELVKKYGGRLAKHIDVPYYDTNKYDQLAIFKIVNFKESGIGGLEKRYSFTEDGHKFYLRTLLEN